MAKAPLEVVTESGGRVPTRPIIETKFARLPIRVRSIYALLTHNPASMLVKDDSPGSKVKKVYVPEEDAAAAAYQLADGSYGMVGIGFRNSMLEAAKAFKMPRSRASMAGLLGHIMVEPELVPLLDWNGKPLRSYVIDSRRVVIMGKGIIRSRPRFEQWSATFEIVYDEALVPNPEILRTIVNDAGARIGVGDYRPQKRGWFGRYALWPE